MSKVLGVGGPTATTNSYVTLLEITLLNTHTKEVSVEVVENNVNAIKYKIEGTIDGSTWETIKAEATLAKNATIDVTPADQAKLKDPWQKIRLQHKADVADTQGNTTVTMVGQ